MGATLTFEFSLSAHAGVTPPRVRLWVDQDDDGFEPVEEVSLTRDELTWSGEVSLPSGTGQGSWFLLKFIAAPDGKARWRFQSWSDGTLIEDLSSLVKHTRNRETGKLGG